VSEHALTKGDPTRTVHFVIGRVLARRINMDTPWDYDDGDSLLAWNLKQDDPDLRRQIAFLINAAWGLLGFGFIVAMAVVGVPLKILVDDATGNAVLTGCLAAGMFCMAGCANVLWRTYYYVPKAKRLAHAGENEAEAYAAVMRRTLPRNTSLIFQTAVAIVTLILAL
jgi:Na+/proline symporter